MKWKGFERKWLWPNFKVLSQNLPRETEETHEKVSHDSRCLSRDLNPGSPKYEEVLTT
jgi:hypothetical protein